MADPHTTAREAQRLLDLICQDSLECSLDRLLAHWDDGETSALFRDLSSTLDALAADLAAARADLQLAEEAWDAARAVLTHGQENELNAAYYAALASSEVPATTEEGSRG